MRCARLVRREAQGGRHLRTRLLGAALVSLIVAGCGAPPASSTPPKPKSKSKPTAKAPPVQQKTLASAFAVSIDNASGAWPQSGIARADIVFEMPAEGNITRYLAVFWHQAPPKIGPVRSTRIYFDNIAAAYGWPLLHAGGNVDALHAIGPLGIKNLDQIYGAGAYFWRSTDRPMPHNLYTSANLAEQGIAAFHYTPAGIPPFTLGKLTGPKVSSVRIIYANWPGVWVYEPSWQLQNGSYVRYVDGKPDLTQAGSAVKAQNVVVIYARQFPDPDPYTPGAVNYAFTSGSGWILSQGVRQGIDWSFNAHGGFSFTLPDGKPVPFAAGQTWVEIVPDGETVDFGS